MTVTPQTAALVQKINQLYHDKDAEQYDKKHDDIFIYEKTRWQHFLRTYIQNKTDVNFLDYGCGTGFITSTLFEEFPDMNISATCYDISLGMLDKCRERIKKVSMNNKTVVCTTDIPVEKKFDVVALNSVLHHLPDQSIFFRDIAAVLRENGLLIIGHEPNMLFYTKKMCYIPSLVIRNIRNPKIFIMNMLELFRLKIFAQKFLRYVPKEGETISFINNELVKEGLIHKPLSKEEIYQYIDFHSPTASGSYVEDKGFDFSSLESMFSPYFDVVQYVTYDAFNYQFHSKFFQWIDKKILTIYPLCGAKFFLVLKRRG